MEDDIVNNLIINTRKLHGRMFGSLLVLRLTTACNMRCAYCYVSEKECTYQQARLDMKFESIKKILDYIDGEIPNCLQIIMTGGEPLLCKPLIEQIINYAEGLSTICRFGIITNGILLNDAFIAYCHDKHISLSISLDSATFEHNKYRVFDDDRLHKRILTNIKKAVQSGVAVGINAVVTDINIDHFRELVDYCVENGIHDFSLLPISNTGRAKNTMNHRVTCAQMYKAISDLNQYLMSLNEKNRKIMVYERNIAVMVDKVLNGTNIPGCCSSPCGAGITMLAMDANGDIYPCDQCIGNVRLKICNIEEEFLSKHISENADVYYMQIENKMRAISCSACELNHLCNGGCIADNISEYGVMGGSKKSYWCSYYRLLYSDILSRAKKSPEKLKWLLPTD